MFPAQDSSMMTSLHYMRMSGCPTSPRNQREQQVHIRDVVI